MGIMIKNEHIYEATLMEIYDGDTIGLLVDLGFDTYVSRSIRLRDVWAPESYEGGEFKLVVGEWFLANGLSVMLQTFVNSRGNDVTTFNRYVGDVYSLEGEWLNEYLRQRIPSGGIGWDGVDRLSEESRDKKQ